MGRRTTLLVSILALLVIGLTAGPAVSNDQPAAVEAKPEAPAKQKERGEAEKKPEPEKKPAEQAPKAKAPAQPEGTYALRKELFKVEVKLNGVFEPGAAAGVTVRPKVWQDYVLKEVATVGKLVKKDDVIARFDTEKIDRVIEQQEAARSFSDLEFKLAEQSLKFMEKAVPIDLAAYERTSRIAQEDLDYFLKTAKEFNKKAADQGLVSAENYLTYVQEELNQLEKMYKHDDLTEETEEIILKRARDSVDRMKFTLEGAKLNRDESVATSLPRAEEVFKQNAAVAKLKLEAAKTNLPTQLNQNRLNFAKLKRDRELAAEYLARLKADRDGMTIKAPFDGIVYYGAIENGRWQLNATIPPRMEPGGAFKPGETFMAVVRPRPLFVRAFVEEKSVRHVRTGVEGRVVPTAFPDTSLGAKVVGVTVVPVSPGQFDARLEVTLSPQDRVLPGMTCAATLVSYRKDDALAVPESAVFTDPKDDVTKFVFLRMPDGKSEMRTVKTGETVGDKTEITEGLAEGDTIFLKKPN